MCGCNRASKPLRIKSLLCMDNKDIFGIIGHSWKRPCIHQKFQRISTNRAEDIES